MALFRCIGLGLALLAASLPSVKAQEEASPQLPKVVLTLPADTAAETVQIRTFMTGPFGGYGSWVKTTPGVSTYEIVAAEDGKPASTLKVIAYLPGCEFEMFEVQIESQSTTRALECRPIRTTTLNAHVSQLKVAPDQPVQIEVNYVAMWSNRFFGIADGPVMAVHLGTAVPNASGEFEIEVPDFAAQAGLGEGHFEFIVGQPKTGIIVATLKPADGSSPWLAVGASYPATLELVAEKR